MSFDLDPAFEAFRKMCEPSPEQAAAADAKYAALDEKYRNPHYFRRLREQEEEAERAAVSEPEPVRQPEPAAQRVDAREPKPATKPLSEPEPTAVKATPYVWRDPASIPPRQWLYGRHAIRGVISVTAASGGTGKTALGIGEALAFVTGRDLLGEQLHSSLIAEPIVKAIIET